MPFGDPLLNHHGHLANLHGHCAHCLHVLDICFHLDHLYIHHGLFLFPDHLVAYHQLLQMSPCLLCVPAAMKGVPLKRTTEGLLYVASTNKINLDRRCTRKLNILYIFFWSNILVTMLNKSVLGYYKWHFPEVFQICKCWVQILPFKLVK